MKVYTYLSHHDLPFWRSPTNPNWVFDPNVIGDWKTVDRSKVPEEQISADKHWVMPILNGLLKIEAPGLVANVSIGFDTQNKMILPVHRCWIQITTEPKTVGENGIPEVVKNGAVQVEGVWGYDNGTYNPYEWIRDMPGYDLNNLPDSDFWRDFFISKLKEQLESEKEELREAQETCNEHATNIARLELALQTK